MDPRVATPHEQMVWKERVIWTITIYVYSTQYFFLLFGLTARQDYFTHFEPSQSLSGARMGDPWEKPPNQPQAERSLFHMWLELG